MGERGGGGDGCSFLPSDDATLFHLAPYLTTCIAEMIQIFESSYICIYIYIIYISIYISYILQYVNKLVTPSIAAKSEITYCSYYYMEHRSFRHRMIHTTRYVTGSYLTM